MGVTEVKTMVISHKCSLKCTQMKTNISHTVSCKESIGSFVMKTAWMKLPIEAVHGGRKRKRNEETEPRSKENTVVRVYSEDD